MDSIRALHCERTQWSANTCSYLPNRSSGESTLLDRRHRSLPLNRVRYGKPHPPRTVEGLDSEEKLAPKKAYGYKPYVAMALTESQFIMAVQDQFVLPVALLQPNASQVLRIDVGWSSVKRS